MRLIIKIFLTSHGENVMNYIASDKYSFLLKPENMGCVKLKRAFEHVRSEQIQFILHMHIALWIHAYSNILKIFIFLLKT